MGKDFLVKVTDPERAEAFRQILGSDVVFVESPVPELANLPGLGERKVFKLDLVMYTAYEKAKLADYIAAKFNIDIDFVKTNLASAGVPILDEDCTVIVQNPQRWVS